MKVLRLSGTQKFVTACIAPAFGLFLSAAGSQSVQADDGAALYDLNCSTCHSGSVKKAPEKTMLQLMSARMILRTLNDGVMQSQASHLDEAQRIAIAEHLSGKPVATIDQPVAPYCGEAAIDIDLPVQVARWGVSAGNERYFDKTLANLSAADLGRLEMAWVVRFPDAIRARSQPALAHGNVYIGSQSSGVVALDAKTGCLRWQFQTGAEVRTGIVVDPDPATPYLYFGDLVGYVYAVDARSGELVWRDRPDDHPSLTITAAPALHDGALFVSLSSLEVTATTDPAYVCCKFRGAVVRYDAHSGEKAWKSYTIPEAPQEVGKTSAGTAIYAPSGAPVWNTPSIDVRRGRLYVGTGENYSSPADGNSDAIIAMDLDTGAVQWVTQATPGDAWNVACEVETDANCPVEDGPDYDFGAATILTTTPKGRDLVLAGQKSGAVYALDPDANGAVVWQRKLGRGGIQGGVHFGMAVAGDALYVPMSDFYGGPRWPGAPYPGMFRVNLTSGETEWYTPNSDQCGDLPHCEPGISAAVSAIPGAVLAGAMDGVMRAYDNTTGEVIWSFDARREFETVDGGVGRGGSFGGASGAVAADGMLYMTSGYGIYEHMPGNILIAFKLREAGG